MRKSLMAGFGAAALALTGAGSAGATMVGACGYPAVAPCARAYGDVAGFFASNFSDFSGTGYSFVPVNATYNYLQIAPGGSVLDTFASLHNQPLIFTLFFSQLAADNLITLHLQSGSDVAISGADIIAGVPSLAGQSGYVVYGPYVQTATFSTGSSPFQIGYAAVAAEPGTWAMMIIGFGAIGVGLRRRSRMAIA